MLDDAQDVHACAEAHLAMERSGAIVLAKGRMFDDAQDVHACAKAHLAMERSGTVVLAKA
jgi:hypothetical protein